MLELVVQSFPLQTPIVKGAGTFSIMLKAVNLAVTGKQ